MKRPVNRYKTACTEIMNMLVLLRMSGMEFVPISIIIPAVSEVILVCTLGEVKVESSET